METSRFDALTKAVSRTTSRRGVLGALLATAAGRLGMAVSGAQPRGKDHHAVTGEGPCGNGSAKANACTRHRQCCTKFCRKRKGGEGRCRCRKLGQSCRESRNCCASGGQPASCQGGICQSGACGPCDGICRHCQGEACVDKPFGTSCVGGPNPNCAVPDTCVCSEGECTELMVSDRERKADVTPADTRAVLQRVAQLPIHTWRYLGEDTEVRHMGPMAQDFAAAFGLGNDERYILGIDGHGVTLASIQALHDEVQTLLERLAVLEAGLTAGICPPKTGSYRLDA